MRRRGLYACRHKPHEAGLAAANPVAAMGKEALRIGGGTVRPRTPHRSPPREALAGKEIQIGEPLA